MKEITKQLEEGIRQLYDSDKYAAWLDVMSKFHNYSFRNCMLIAMQKPDATHVAGFKKWQSLERHVMKGEKGIRIIAPSPFKIKTECMQKDSDGNTVLVANVCRNMCGVICRSIDASLQYLFNDLRTD